MEQVNERKFDQIIENMLDNVDKSKDEIYQLTETTIEEQKTLSEELQTTRNQVTQYILRGEELEKAERTSRNQLALVSKNFNVYSEEEIKEVYEQTDYLQAELKKVQVRELTLRHKRDYLERRLKSLDEIINKGSDLVTKVSVISNYLADDFKQISDLIEDAQQKQAFGLKIIEAQEEERLRISREIHDGPAQMLANILLRADLVDRTFKERSEEEAMVEMQSMRRMVRQSIQEVRRIIYDLRPMTLDDLGLIPTIRKYLANVEDYHNLTINLREKGNFADLTSTYEVALFRLTQESIQNAVKHAEAHQIQVVIQIDENEVTLAVRDDGVGFDLKQKKDQSFGLIGMRERVEMLEGQFAIHSKLGKGTAVYIKIPLN